MNHDVIKVPTVNKEVYEQFRYQISIGQLSPGEKITIRKIAEKFGVSTMPVREAIRRLQAEGFLNLERRSVTIRKLSLEEVKQMFIIRQRLETLALEWALSHIKEDDLKGLHEILKLMDNEHISYSEWQQMNRTFHLQLYEFSKSKQLNQLIKNIWDAVNPYMYIFTTTVDRMKKMLKIYIKQVKWILSNLKRVRIK
jgi:DNA-binding GntR family transcriptional regulator